MDALDEFFRVWSEPEAWCERCQSSPAIHVVVQDDDHMDGMTITYAYIWEAETQVQIPVCRSCSQHYIDSLGSSDFKYANRKKKISQPTPSSESNRTDWRHAFIALVQRLRWCFKLPRRRRSLNGSQANVYLSRSQR